MKRLAATLARGLRLCRRLPGRFDTGDAETLARIKFPCC